MIFTFYQLPLIILFVLIEAIYARCKNWTNLKKIYFDFIKGINILYIIMYTFFKNHFDFTKGIFIVNVVYIIMLNAWSPKKSNYSRCSKMLCLQDEKSRLHVFKNILFGKRITYFDKILRKLFFFSVEN